jgi:hypothetical protein
VSWALPFRVGYNGHRGPIDCATKWHKFTDMQRKKWCLLQAYEFSTILGRETSAYTSQKRGEAVMGNYNSNSPAMSMAFI